MQATLDELLQHFDAGGKRAAARLISIVEEGGADAAAILDRLYARVGRAARIGVTGPPGAGKSTLVDGLTQRFVARGDHVGVVAVDPTSPFTGGAILGDRVRMGAVANDPKVFFRSLGSRGSLGGLSLHTAEVADVLDAFGCTQVLIETVGVGQSELDIADKAHTTLVVLVPESGDGVQTLKAGLMEIADIFVVNKADRNGARTLVGEIEATLALKEWSGWRPPVLLTEAREDKDKGIDELFEALARHRSWLVQHDELRVRTRRALESRVRDLVQDAVLNGLWQAPEVQRAFRDGVVAIEAGTTTPYRLADLLAGKSFERR